MFGTSCEFAGIDRAVFACSPGVKRTLTHCTCQYTEHPYLKVVLLACLVIFRPRTP